MINSKICKFPFTEIIIQKIVSENILKQSIRIFIKPAYEKMNLKAMCLGFKLADNYNQDKL